MQEAKIKNLIALIITDFKGFQKEYETLTEAEVDAFQPYLNRLQDKDYIEKVKGYIREQSNPEVKPRPSPWNRNPQ